MVFLLFGCFFFLSPNSRRNIIRFLVFKVVLERRFLIKVLEILDQGDQGSRFWKTNI